VAVNDEIKTLPLETSVLIDVVVITAVVVVVAVNDEIKTLPLETSVLVLPDPGVVLDCGGAVTFNGVGRTL
jgi:hypothetical protein